MFPVGVASIGFQLLEGSPVLDDDPEAHDVAEEARFGGSLKLLQHSGHRPKHWQPLMQLPWLVDTHSDEEHDKISVHFCGHALGYDGGHSPLSFSSLPG